MISQTVTYQDLMGNSRTDTLYFHLNEKDLLDLEFNQENSFIEQMQAAVDQGNTRLVYLRLKDLIRASYGERSEDGRRFLRDEAKFMEFEGSEPYNQFLLDLMGSADRAAAFFNGLIDLEKMKKISEANAGKTPEQVRADMEAKMQGFKKKQDPQPKEVVTVNNTAVAAPNVANMTEEEKAALRAQLGM